MALGIEYIDNKVCEYSSNIHPQAAVPTEELYAYERIATIRRIERGKRSTEYINNNQDYKKYAPELIKS